MWKLTFGLLLCLLFSSPTVARAQYLQSFAKFYTGTTVPTTCQTPSVFLSATTGSVYTCQAHVYVLLGVGGGGTILPSQLPTFTTGTNGTDFNVQPDVSEVVFNLPTAQCEIRGAIDGTPQVFCGNKTFQGDTLMDGSLYVTEFFSTDNPIEITGAACTASEANVGLLGFDPATGLPCFSYDGSTPGSIPVKWNALTAPDGDLTLDMGGRFTYFNTTTTPAIPSFLFGDPTYISGGGFIEIQATSNMLIGGNTLLLFGEPTDVSGGGFYRNFFSQINSKNASGVMGEATAGDFLVRQTGAGTLTSAIGLKVNSSAAFAGTITNTYGLKVEDQTAGTTNYAIKTGLGQNSLGDRLTVKSNAAAVQLVTFTGAGLNDATSGGTYTGLNDLAYCVQIDASVPSPDTFKWGTGGSCSNGATGVGITGAAQNLSNGVQITFAAIDGHTIGDNWTFTAYAPIPLTLQDSSGNITAKVRETGDVLGRRFFANTGTALVSGDFVPSSGWGASGSVAVLNTATEKATDQSFHITVTAAGAGQGLNPTVAFTFKDGTWTIVPHYTCTMETGGTGALSFFTPDNTSATVLTLTYAGTPVINLTYKIACNAWGI